MVLNKIESLNLDTFTLKTLNVFNAPLNPGKRKLKLAISKECLSSITCSFHNIRLFPLRTIWSSGVTCTCQSHIVRMQHIPLAWQTSFTWLPRFFTTDEKGQNNSPFKLWLGAGARLTPTQWLPAKFVYNSKYRKSSIRLNTCLMLWWSHKCARPTHWHWA